MEDTKDLTANTRSPHFPTSDVERIHDNTAMAKMADGSTYNKGEGTQIEGTLNDSRHAVPWSFFILFFGLALTVFCIGLDNTIVATAIPQITDVFGSLDDVGWYGSAFLLAMTSLQPSYGRIYTFFSVKWTYITALLLFELASIICAAATSSSMLIVGRALAGAGSAGLFGGGFTIIGLSVPVNKRAMYIAVLASLYGVSSVVGPLLGGALTDNVSWRWCFWINLPFGAVALACVGFCFSDPQREEMKLSVKRKWEELDPFGALLLICAMVCLFLALQWGGSTMPWSNSKVWGCIVGFGLIIILFGALQYRKKAKATVPLHIVSQRTILSASLFIFFAGIVFYVHVYYLAFYFQTVRSTSAKESGIRTIPYLLSNTIFSLVTGALITTIGYYSPFVWVGAAVLTVGSGLIQTLDRSSSAATWIGYQILAGIGIGTSIQVPFTAAQVVLSEKDAPTGISLVIFAQQLGGALAVSIAQNIFQTELTRELLAKVPTLDPSAVISAGASRIEGNVPEELLGPILDAYQIALARTFILPIVAGGLGFLCSLGLELRSVKEQGAGQPESQSPPEEKT